MNVLKGPGSIIYALVTLIAFLSSLLISLTSFWGFAYGGTESVAYDSVVAILNLCTLGLAIGVIEAWTSPHRGLTITTLLSSACLFLIVGSYFLLILYKAPTTGMPLIGLSLFVLIQGTAMILSFLRFRQLHAEVTPCPQ